MAMKTVRAYHFLREDMAAGYGTEPAWTVGETRSLKGGSIIPCRRGYHASPTPFDAIRYAPGSMLCLVELSGKTIFEDGSPVDKFAARHRTLIAAKDVSRELRLFAADCAEHVLHLFEGRYPEDMRPRQAIKATRKFTMGEITAEEMEAASYASYAYASYASSAAASASFSSEKRWQRERAKFYFSGLFAHEG